MTRIQQLGHLKILRAPINLANGTPDEVQVYQRLFVEARHGMNALNAHVEPTLAAAKSNDEFQFERHGSFVADRVDHAAEELVFNLAVGLKNSLGEVDLSRCGKQYIFH